MCTSLFSHRLCFAYLQLQNSVAEPLIVPPPSQPVLRTDKFERLWVSGDQEEAVTAGQLSIAAGTLSVAATGRSDSGWLPALSLAFKAGLNWYLG